MNNWKSYYTSHLCSAEDAVKQVQSGNRIVLSHACGEPRLLPGELAKRAGELKGVEICHMVPMGEALYCRPEVAESFRHVALFTGAPTHGRLSGTTGVTTFLMCLARFPSSSKRTSPSM